jgi:hypothetical protein
VVPDDRKFIKLQSFYIKLRFVALGAQFFLLVFLRYSSKVALLMTLINFWILSPFIYALSHAQLFRAVKTDIIKSYVVWLVPVFLILLTSSWVSVITDNLETTIFCLARVCLVFLIVYHLTNKEYFKVAKIGTYLTLFMLSFK